MYLEGKHYKISKNSCHEWIRGKNRGGYGKITYKTKGYRAHRLAYEVANGDFNKKLHVLHKCDNPSCVNPEHLFLGTHQDNMRDRDKKGRNIVPIQTKKEVNYV